MLPMFNAVQNRLKATISAANTLLIEGYQIVHLEPSALTAKPVIIVANDPRLWQAVKDGRAVYYRTGTDDPAPIAWARCLCLTPSSSGSRGALMRASFNARVRMTVSTHIASAGGKSASCTMGPEFAVKRLADKLWGEGKHVHADSGHDRRATVADPAGAGQMNAPEHRTLGLQVPQQLLMKQPPARFFDVGRRS